MPERRPNRFFPRIACLPLGAALALAVAPALADETKLSFYGMFPAVTYEFQNDFEFQDERADLIEDFELGFSGEFVSTRGDWIYGAELFYARASGDRDLGFPIGDSGDEDRITNVGDSSSVSTVVNAFAGYRVYDRDESQIHVVGGLRYASIDTDIEVATDTEAFEISQSEALVDATLGVRVSAHLADGWSLPLNVDVGAGSSEFTFNMFAGLTYSMGANDFTVGYRKLEWLLDEDDSLKRFQYMGPVIGYSRRF